ncbi:hypothetical protein Hte_001840 [Hypoxylon texense]
MAPKSGKSADPIVADLRRQADLLEEIAKRRARDEEEATKAKALHDEEPSRQAAAYAAAAKGSTEIDTDSVNNTEVDFHIGTVVEET